MSLLVVPADLFADDPIEADRYRTLDAAMATWPIRIAGREVMDFGASAGLSMVALLAHGARSVLGIKPDAERVARARATLTELGVPDTIGRVEHVPDTRALPCDEAMFDVVLANAVLEHIPPPRAPYVREMWRVLRPHGALVVHETPNLYFPKEIHTTGLWFNHWLPIGLAHRRAVRRGRFRADRLDWASSGWRGVGHYALLRMIPGPVTITPDRTHWRHRLLAAMGVPAGLLDPYPLWILTKGR